MMDALRITVSIQMCESTLGAICFSASCILWSKSGPMYYVNLCKEFFFYKCSTAGLTLKYI